MYMYLLRTIRAYWSKRRVVRPVLFRTTCTCNYYSIEILHGVTTIILTYMYIICINGKTASVKMKGPSSPTGLPDGTQAISGTVEDFNNSLGAIGEDPKWQPTLQPFVSLTLTILSPSKSTGGFEWFCRIDVHVGFEIPKNQWCISDDFKGLEIVRILHKLVSVDFEGLRYMWQGSSIKLILVDLKDQDHYQQWVSRGVGVNPNHPKSSKILQAAFLWKIQHLFKWGNITTWQEVQAISAEYKRSTKVHGAFWR